ncbi:MAG TPA: ATP-dependent DNA helicase, partial [Planctomycetaceae bacterium]|nr:ATP-dependent DNA helicase [Planctomycetaceae bacterium]
YPAYQKYLLSSNAVDFDDLLLHVVHLFEENDEIRSQYDDRYQYVLVDEYQDTNEAQYRIVRALSQNSRNLSVTGDPD